MKKIRQQVGEESFEVAMIRREVWLWLFNNKKACSQTLHDAYIICEIHICREITPPILHKK